jgi:hypothetical protein
MHSVERLEQLKALAEDAGYIIRYEWLGGVGGGACEFAGRKWIFIDLALSVLEQLQQVEQALQADPTLAGRLRGGALARGAALRKAA